jgi:hypothetical protein
MPAQPGESVEADVAYSEMARAESQHKDALFASVPCGNYTPVVPGVKRIALGLFLLRR